MKKMNEGNIEGLRNDLLQYYGQLLAGKITPMEATKITKKANAIIKTEKEILAKKGVNKFFECN